MIRTCLRPQPAFLRHSKLQAPPFTHWTGTTVDYPYIRSSAKRRVGVDGVYIVNSHSSPTWKSSGLMGDHRKSHRATVKKQKNHRKIIENPRKSIGNPGETSGTGRIDGFDVK